jgi:hypothetical protein
MEGLQARSSREAGTVIVLVIVMLLPILGFAAYAIDGASACADGCEGTRGVLRPRSGAFQRLRNCPAWLLVASLQRSEASAA